VSAATRRGRVLRGLGISPGVALGPIYFFENDIGEVPRLKLAAGAVEREVSRLRKAFAEAEEEFRRQRVDFKGALTQSERRIFDAHLELYQDDLLRKSIETRIARERVNAEAALKDEIEHLATLFSGMDTLFRERVADVRDVGNRVHRVLVRRQQAKLATGKPVILYARELLPSDTLNLDRSRLLGIVTEVGGEASHVAILARASGLPAVSGVQRLDAQVKPGTEIGLDGVKGRLVVAPSKRERAAILRTQSTFARERARVMRQTTRTEAERAAGVHLLLNIENFEHLDASALQSVDGIGLYRTEFLFMGRQTFPSEEEQLAFYTDVLRHVGDREVTFRTIDVGGDKPLRYLETPREQNPALGWRGIRLTFQWPDLNIPQLRALLRASAHGRPKILLPMVTNVEEVRKARRLLSELRDDLRKQGHECRDDVALGAMIEVPAAALAADALLEEVDFLSVGTNDLLQYLFAVDRNNQRVASLYQPLHPVVLELLGRLFAIARSKGKEITVCGEMAGEFLGALALFGLGLRRFSMSPAHLAAARTVFRLFAPAEAEALVKAVGSLRTQGEVEDFLRAAALEKGGADAAPFLHR
jgi:phosphotransferase system enzyme I (PtsI)